MTYSERVTARGPRHPRSASASFAPTVLEPGAAIGVLGGGQLGRMLALAARRMGYRIIVLDPNPRCPTAQVSDGVVVGTLDDPEAAMHLAAQVDVVTLDTEHVPADVLDAIDARVPVRPGPGVLRTIQDRLTQKTFLDQLGVRQAPWLALDSEATAVHALGQLGTEVIFKVRRSGYDGKGQFRVASVDQAVRAFAQLRGEPAVAEARVPFVREISVVLARSMHGEVEVFPLAENAHRNHVLHTTRAPAPASAGLLAEATAIASNIAHALAAVGIVAVEMFELADGSLLVNEIAPRTHNSGHFTYGACVTSQFEQHVRAICGLPLGTPTGLRGAVMLNLLGDLWANGEPPWREVLGRPNARLHLYGKNLPAPGRKMGHVVLLDDDTDRALADAEAVFAALHQAAQPSPTP